MKILDKKPKYYLDKDSAFVIEDYNYAKPFSNFFPGIAGYYGIPMWTFYVNRGQAISSFGIKDKDHAILEFQPANKAWQFVTTHGFRTFIKIVKQGKILYYEPFHNGFASLGFNIANKMFIQSWGLGLEETNFTLGLKVKVEYFNIPSDNYAGLARILTVTNIAGADKTIELIDGLPQIVPYGTNNFFLKKMSRTIEAWMSVENLKENAPFYRLTVDPSDRPEVIHINEGNFYLGFSFKDKTAQLLEPIVNPEYIFGAITDFSYPRNFLKNNKFVIPKDGTTKSKTPSSMSFLSFKLGKNQEKDIYSVIGYMRSLKELNSSIAKITDYAYLAKKRKENIQIIEELKDAASTSSSSKEFNLYSQQTYLDNLLRGGCPCTFNAGASVFYIYSRKHGDPERDYNKFQLAPTYFSQGNGNYRDLNQNRRNDIWFNPEIKDENLTSLLNLIQLDGFNPLVVKGISFILKDNENLKNALKDACFDKDIESIIAFLNKPFSPGEAILFLEDNNIKLKISYNRFLDLVISSSLKTYEAEHGEGFWTDHWHYNIDLIHSYLKVYPEKLEETIFKTKNFTFFDNSQVVKPRSEKYLIYNGSPRQLHAVAVDNVKKEMLHKRHESPHIVRTQFGQGIIYKTTMLNKLLCLLGNKFASLDPFGVGIEMEADKPNWFDALNGLPALFGSSLCETWELKRLALFIKGALEETGIEKVGVTEEIYSLLKKLKKLTCDYFNKDSGDFVWWDQAHLIKEFYLSEIKLGLSGNETEIASKELIEIIDIFLRKIESGISKAQDKEKNVYYGYFINTVTEYKNINERFIEPLGFKQTRLPLFLETQMHALRLSINQDQARRIYQGTKKSALYDKKLKMYKVTAPLAKMPEEIGRCRIFTPGWLENESIWMHMEYKYILELLKAGLYEEFYRDFKNTLVPFQKPEVYGRSILENSSFIASSAFADKKLHGNGFIARLSGSTAEFLEIWLTINAGAHPFYLNKENKLNLCFKPVLAHWLFDKQGNYSFNFLSRIRVTYHNPKRKDTFGKNAARTSRIVFNGQNGLPVEITSETIPAPYAEQVRSRQIHKIDIYLK